VCFCYIGPYWAGPNRDVPDTDRTDSAQILWNGTDVVERNGFTRGPERIMGNGTDLLMDQNGLAQIRLSILGPWGPWGLMGPYGSWPELGRDP